MKKLILFGLGVVMATLVSSATAVPTVVNITTVGSSGTANGARFVQWDSTSAQGTGAIDPFLRIQNIGAESGYNLGIEGTNTGLKPLDDKDSSGTQFNHVLLLSTMPVVNIGGIDYREISLDLNQSGSDPYLSLDQLKIFNSSNGTLTDPTGLTPIYDLGDNMVAMNYILNGGSGQGDVLVYIPNSSFAQTYVYLYSKFGASDDTSVPGNPSGDWAANAGFEEWAVRVGAPVVPAPSAILLAVIGTSIVGWMRRKRAL